MMAKDTAYNIAWHIKSFYFGKWSDKFFPILFCPEIIITYNTEAAASCLVDVCDGTGSGNLPVANWTY